MSQLGSYKDQGSIQKWPWWRHLVIRKVDLSWRTSTSSRSIINSRTTRRHDQLEDKSNWLKTQINRRASEVEPMHSSDQQIDSMSWPHTYLMSKHKRIRKPSKFTYVRNQTKIIIKSRISQKCYFYVSIKAFSIRKVNLKQERQLASYEPN